MTTALARPVSADDIPAAVLSVVDGRTVLLRPTSPKPRSSSSRPPSLKRLGSQTTGLTSSVERLNIPKTTTTTTGTPAPPVRTLERKKSKKSLLLLSTHGQGEQDRSCPLTCNFSLDPTTTKSSSSAAASMLLRSYSTSSLTTTARRRQGAPAAGSIAAGRREQMALQNAQRKIKIGHYGRSKSAKFDSCQKANEIVASFVEAGFVIGNGDGTEQYSAAEPKRCSFITPNSDPVYVAYHDEEWGVPTHDDRKLFELLVLSGAQVGSDWTSILKKRKDFRRAFHEFDAEVVSSFTEMEITSISESYTFDLGRVRGIVDNANRILEINKEFGSFDKYLWGFINNKPISPNYKFGYKIPVKTSKSESISKDMVRRGFRFTGPTVVHAFMQAAGLTNDHLISCYCHHQPQL